MFAFSGTLYGQNGYNLMVVSWVENEYLFDGEYNEIYIIVPTSDILIMPNPELEAKIL